jgi:hypothetical protein
VLTSCFPSHVRLCARQLLSGLTAAEFDTVAVRAAFSLAVQECVTYSGAEDIYATNITVVTSTAPVEVEVTFEQGGAAHSLGYREAPAAISAITDRLTTCCEAGGFDAILRKVEGRLQHAALLAAEFDSVLLRGARVHELACTAVPSSEPSAAALAVASDGSDSGGLGISMPVIIGMGAGVASLCALWVVYVCFRKPVSAGPRERRKAVANLQVLPAFQEQRGHRRRVGPSGARGVQVMATVHTDAGAGAGARVAPAGSPGGSGSGSPRSPRRGSSESPRSSRRGSSESPRSGSRDLDKHKSSGSPRSPRRATTHRHQDSSGSGGSGSSRRR